MLTTHGINCKNIDIVSKEIYDFLKIREAAELNRISDVINLINSNECQSKLLSNYFGEILEKNCGKCSYCLSNKKLNLTRNHIQFEFSEKQIQWIDSLLKQEDDYLKKSNILAKILVGITSPVITKLKLNKLNIFGKLSYVPYHVIQNNLKNHFSKIIEFEE